ncbi:MAG: hypothetical protein KDE48_05625 [Anaerolineales bacterium]|nr:hypothetical protein [Anaerolineales bacterium]
MFNFKKKSVVLIVVALLILTAVSVVFAAGYDLTTVPSDATINGAIFQAIAPSDPTGSGGFDAFLRTQADVSEKGYNNEMNNSDYEFDEVSGCCTHEITLAEIPEVLRQADGIKYRIFELDINETNSAPLITLDTVEIYEAADGNICGYPFDGSATIPPCPAGTINTATMIYDMDAGENNFVVLDYDNNAGSGKRDLRLWVPDALFSQDPNCDYQSPDANLCTTYIVLYNEFGLDFDANAASPLDTAHNTDDGFEEWGVPTEDIPTAISFSDISAGMQTGNFIWIGLAFLLLIVLTVGKLQRNRA